MVISLPVKVVPARSRMKSALAAAIALLCGCAFPDAQVRKQAALDFGCPKEDVWAYSEGSGYLAQGCRKEASYSVHDGRVTRTSEIRPTGETRPPLPIDRIPNTNSIGLD
jgi:hypothetical protein